MDTKNIEILQKYINDKTIFLLVNHIRMDPDALGSLGAFYFLLKKLGKTVYAINDDPMPENYFFLAGESIITPSLDIQSVSPEIIISFDAASIDQLGNTYTSNKTLFDTQEFFVLDHHITNPGFGKYNIIDTQTSSSCELVYDIIKQMGFESYIDEKIATLLLAGIHTDTNSFYNKNTSVGTMEKAAELLNKGANQRQIIFEFFRKKSLEKVHLWGNILKDIQTSNNGSIVWATVKKNQYSNLSIGDQGLKGLLNEFLANIEGVQVAFLLYETGSGVKASLRSNDDTIDVAQLCSTFGGGGHKLAAGFSSGENLENIEKQLVQSLSTLVSSSR